MRAKPFNQWRSHPYRTVGQLPQLAAGNRLPCPAGHRKPACRARLPRPAGRREPACHARLPHPADDPLPACPT